MANKKYVLTGWSIGQDDNIPEENALLNVTEDRIVYACWDEDSIKLNIDPVTREIKSSWAEIAAVVDQGDYKEQLHRGDWKPLSFGDKWGTVNMEITDFDVDQLANSEKVAPITWLSCEVLKQTIQWNLTNSVNGGYPASNIKKVLQGEVFNAMDESLKPYLQTVNKTCSLQDGTDVVDQSYLWIASKREVYFFNASNKCEQSGPIYINPRGYTGEDWWGSWGPNLMKANGTPHDQEYSIHVCPCHWLRSCGENKVFRCDSEGDAFIPVDPTNYESAGIGFCTGGTPKAITDPATGEINLSWEEIAELVDNGTYKEVLSPHNWKYADFGTNGLIPMEIAGFDLDEIPDELCVVRYHNDSSGEDKIIATETVSKGSSPKMMNLVVPIYEGPYNSSDWDFDVWTNGKNGEGIHSSSKVVGDADLYAQFKSVYMGTTPVAGVNIGTPRTTSLYAPITWIAKEALTGTFQWNTTDNVGNGYPTSKLANTFENIFNSMDSEVKKVICTSSKSYKYMSGSKAVTENANMDVWPPSRRELRAGNDNYQETDGPIYSEVYPNNESCVKCEVGTNQPVAYWQRSAGTTIAEGTRNAACILEDGSQSNKPCSSYLHIVPCFCTTGNITKGVDKTHTVRFINPYFDDWGLLSSTSKDVVLSTVVVNPGETVNYTESVTINGTIFAGAGSYFTKCWTKDRNLADSADSSKDFGLNKDTVNEDLDLYARWAPQDGPAF